MPYKFKSIDEILSITKKHGITLSITEEELNLLKKIKKENIERFSNMPTKEAYSNFVRDVGNEVGIIIRFEHEEKSIDGNALIDLYCADMVFDSIDTKTCYSPGNKTKPWAILSDGKMFKIELFDNYVFPLVYLENTEEKLELLLEGVKNE